MKNIQNLTIDINKKPFQTITANVGEVASRFIRITILENNMSADLTGVTAYLYAKKADGTKVFNSITVENAKQGIVLAELTSQVLAIPGLVKLTLLLTKDGAKLASKQIIVTVDESAIDEESIESTNEFNALTDALKKVNNIDNKLDKNAILSMANMGQDVKEAMTGGSVAVVGENAITNINVIPKGLKEYNMAFLENISKNLFNPHTVSNGYLLNLSNGQLEGNSNYWTSDFIEVEPNTTYVGSDMTFRCEYDINKNFIKGYSSKSSTTGENTKYMKVTSNIYELFYFCKDNIIEDSFDKYKLSDTIIINGEKIEDKTISSNKLSFIQTKLGINLFNKELITDNAYINNGSYVSNSNYCVTDFIKVEPGCTYVKSGDDFAYCDIYDINKKCLSSVVSKSVKIPGDGAYIKWSIEKLYNNINTLMICKDSLPSEYIPYKENIIIDNLHIDYEGIENNLKNKSYWSNKNWVAIGDSITEWSYNDENGVKVNWRYVVNDTIGFSSSKCCAYWGHKMGDIQEIMEYAGVTEEDISNADIITVSLGQNDIQTPIGSIDDEPSFKQGSFYGDTKGLIEYLLSLNNKCTLAFITPTPSSGSETKLRELSNIIIEVCEKYSIPVLDLNKMSNFNKSNYGYFYIDSSVHPNGIGNKRMGRITANFINQL